MRVRAIVFSLLYRQKNPSTIPEKTRKVAYDYAIFSEKFYHISNFVKAAQRSGAAGA
jgi:hypothetical protein